MRGAFVWLLALGMAVFSVQAQDQRDPTQPPAAMGGDAAGASANKGPLGSDGVAVIVRAGKPYLVVGTRLYAVGKTIEHRRIERITETEVWLKEGAVLHKVPRFAGIQRSVAASVPSCGAAPSKPVRAKVSTGAPAKTSSSNASKVAPCNNAQP